MLDVFWSQDATVAPAVRKFKHSLVIMCLLSGELCITK